MISNRSKATRILLFLGLALPLGMFYAWWRTTEAGQAMSVTEPEPIVVGRLESTRHEPAAALEPSRHLQETVADDTVRSTRFRIRGRDDPHPDAFIAMARASSHEYARILLGERSLGIVEWDVKEGPPQVMVGAPAHLPVFLSEDDARWAEREIEITLEPEKLVELLVRDLVSGNPISGATVHNLQLHSIHCARENMPWVGWPRATTTDDGGRATLRVPSGSSSLLIHARALGYSPLRKLNVDAASGQATVDLAPVLVAGLSIRFGRNDTPARDVGSFARVQRSDSPAHLTLLSVEESSELLDLLSTQTGMEKDDVRWSFAALRPEGAGAIELPLDGEFKYLLYPHGPVFEGALHYHPVRQFRRDHLASLDVTAHELASLSRLEIDFEGDHDPEQTPAATWSVVPAVPHDNSAFRSSRCKRSDPEQVQGVWRYTAHVGPGEYVIAPRKGFLNVAAFDPVRVEVSAGTTQRVRIPESSAKAPELTLRVLDQHGNVDHRLTSVSIGKQGAGGTAVMEVEGELRCTILSGQYSVRFFTRDGASDVLPLEVHDEDVTVVYRPTPEDVDR